MVSGTAQNGLDFDRFYTGIDVNRKAFASPDDYIKRDKCDMRNMTWSGGFRFAIVRHSREQVTTCELVTIPESEDGLASGGAGDEARAEGSRGAFVPPMSGQAEFDKKLYS